MRVASGYERAADIAVKHLEKISDQVHWDADNTDVLYRTAMTTLGSKIISRCQSKMAHIAVDAVLAVADLERKVLFYFLHFCCFIFFIFFHFFASLLLLYYYYLFMILMNACIVCRMLILT